MNTYTFYNAVTGDVMFVSKLRRVNDAELTKQSLSDCDFIEGEYPADIWRFQNGKPVKISDAQLSQAMLERQWGLLRSQRDAMLAACDWTQVPDAPVDQAAWAAYRQALRDLPSNTVDPANPDWPTPPST